MAPRARFRLWATVLAVLAILSVSGCSSSPESYATAPFGPFAPFDTVIMVPAPVNPEGLVRLLEWCYSGRDTGNHRTLFTDDYRFAFGPLDPEGSLYRTTPWTREDELAYFDHLIHGGDVNQPAARNLTLIFDRNFQVADDPRPGKSAPWHRMIRTSVTLRFTAGEGAREIQGFATFFVVRGDSAAIPGDLKPRGTLPDSVFWYIERWEDDTLPSEVSRAMPSERPTWGGIKALYR